MAGQWAPVRRQCSHTTRAMGHFDQTSTAQMHSQGSPDSLQRSRKRNAHVSAVTTATALSQWRRHQNGSRPKVKITESAQAWR